MKRKKFTEEQIIGVLKEAEAGAKTADLARRHGVSEATIYNWKAKMTSRMLATFPCAMQVLLVEAISVTCKAICRHRGPKMIGPPSSPRKLTNSLRAPLYGPQSAPVQRSARGPHAVSSPRSRSIGNRLLIQPVRVRSMVG